MRITILSTTKLPSLWERDRMRVLWLRPVRRQVQMTMLQLFALLQNFSKMQKVLRFWDYNNCRYEECVPRTDWMSAQQCCQVCADPALHGRLVQLAHVGSGLERPHRTHAFSCRAALARRICRIEDKDEPFNTFSSDHGPRGCAKLEGVFSLDANRGTWIRPTVENKVWLSSN